MRARLLTCALLLVGCAERSSIVIEVTSDFAAPDEIDALTIEVTGADSSATLNETIELTSDFPHTYRVLPLPEFAGEAVTITVTGTLSGSFVARQSTQSGFVADAHRTVTMRLHRACMGVTTCAPGVPCNADGMCMGVSAECDSNDDCTDPFSCTVDSCQGGVCIREPRDELCPEGTVCHETRGCAEPCTDDPSCADDMFCNGVETCVAEHCLFATRPACNDGDICTTDTCDEATDTCGAETPQELCNGMDDDCDATCDNGAGMECCQGSVAPCTTSCGTMGTALCGESCTLRTCEPPAEACDGTDEDCDGRCDNGFACCRGMPATCTTSCGSTGTVPCDDTCSIGTCTPPAETCNGIDDNCDGTCDDGFACCGGIPQACATSCDPPGTETGTQTCDDTCTLQGSCTPPAEDCTNERDDDCDGDVDCLDSACTTTPACTGGCVECTTEVAIATPGGRRSATLGADNHMGSCGGAGGSEAYFTFTVGEPTDVFATTHGAGMDTVLYLRSGSNCCGSEVACNDDADGMNTSVLRTNVPAGTYHLFVDTKAPMSGSISVDIFIEAPGSGGMGDRCASPVFIPAGATQVTGSAAGFGNDYRAAAAAGTGCPDVNTQTACDRVYYFYLPTATTVTFNGCDASAANSYDQLAYIRSVCTDGAMAAQSGCNDDCSNPTVQCDNGRRNANVTATIGPGLFYFIADGWCPSSCNLASTCACGSYDYAVTGL